MTDLVDDYIESCKEEGRLQIKKDEQDLIAILFLEELIQERKTQIENNHTIVWKHEWANPVHHYFPDDWDIITYIPHLYPVQILSWDVTKEKAVYYTHHKQKLWWSPPSRSTFDIKQLKLKSWYVIQDIHIIDHSSEKYKTMWEWLDAVEVSPIDVTNGERYLTDWETLPWLKQLQASYEQSHDYSQMMNRLSERIREMKRNKN